MESGCSARLAPLDHWTRAPLRQRLLERVHVSVSGSTQGQPNSHLNSLLSCSCKRRLCLVLEKRTTVYVSSIQPHHSVKRFAFCKFFVRIRLRKKLCMCPTHIILVQHIFAIIFSAYFTIFHISPFSVRLTIGKIGRSESLVGFVRFSGGSGEWTERHSALRSDIYLVFVSCRSVFRIREVGLCKQHTNLRVGFNVACGVVLV